MNYLAKHIETLVGQHECVIVPHFGGFVAQVQSAYSTDSGDTFMPPTHTVGFNSKLLGNDGILVQSYMEVHGLSESDAKRLLQSDILDMRKALLYQGVYDLGRLGVLKQDEDGEIAFWPNNGWTAPELFGLETLDFERIDSERETESNPQQTFAEKQTETQKDHITVHINRRMLHTAISVAAAILLFFMVSTPVNTNTWNRCQALLAQDILSSALKFMPRMETGLAISADSAAITLTQNNITAKSDSKSSAPQATVQEPSNAITEEFAVVIASAIPEANARDYVEHLQRKGFPDATLHKHGAMVRVLFRGFTSETEALEKLSALQKHAEFRHAWVLQMK